MIELRQQVEQGLRRAPFDIDRVYRDGRAVAVVARADGARVHAFKRYAASEAALLLNEINEAREQQGLFGPCVDVVQPVSSKRIEKLRKEMERTRDA